MSNLLSKLINKEQFFDGERKRENDKNRNDRILTIIYFETDQPHLNSLHWQMIAFPDHHTNKMQIQRTEYSRMLHITRWTYNSLAQRMRAVHLWLIVSHLKVIFFKFFIKFSLGGTQYLIDGSVPRKPYVQKTN